MPQASLATILVIDNDAASRVALSQTLTNVGYWVIEASNGREGLSLFMQKHPKLVLMNAFMPIMDGFSTTRAIREYEQRHAVPILMLTEIETSNAIEEAFDAGATDFISKPINLSLLPSKVKYTLQASQIEDRLRLQTSELDFTMRLAKLGYWEWDAPRDQVRASEVAFDIFNVPATKYTPIDQFLGHVLPKDKHLIYQSISELEPLQRHIQVNFRITAHDGSIRHIECLGNADFTAGGQLQKIIGSAQDVSRLHRAESEIEYQSTHDRLTNLPKRSLFAKIIDQQISEQPRSINAVILFDIDRFKHINNHLGQEHADQLLSALSQRLKRIIGEGNSLSRLGSDEFGILITNLKNVQEFNHILSHFEERLKKGFMIKKQEIFITLSSGIAFYPLDAKNAHDLINSANIARGRAKTQGGSQSVFFQNQMTQSAKESLLLEYDLRNALINEEIEVYYQPQVAGDTLLPYGAEALVRWKHPKFGMISPTDFIPLAETTGLINEIGLYVLQRAIKAAEMLLQQGYSLKISVNLSSKQLSYQDLMQEIQKILSNSKMPSNMMTLEITESMAMQDPSHTVHLLKGLKAMGFGISIDDFGTGYSSLAYLQSFPIDAIKIDRSFVINLDSSSGQVITAAIIAMAHSLGLTIVAEGIENRAQAKFLQEKKCQVFQGFRYGKPMSFEKLNRWVIKRSH